MLPDSLGTFGLRCRPRLNPNCASGLKYRQSLLCLAHVAVKIPYRQYPNSRNLSLRLSLLNQALLPKFTVIGIYVQVVLRIYTHHLLVSLTLS